MKTVPFSSKPNVRAQVSPCFSNEARREDDHIRDATHCLLWLTGLLAFFYDRARRLRRQRAARNSQLAPDQQLRHWLQGYGVGGKISDSNLSKISDSHTDPLA